jgi:HK97 family phage prohead protease
MSTLTFTEASEIRFKARAGQINIDKAQGIVECFVAAIGNKDSVGDIIIPGAFDASLKRRKPRVVWGHNWNEPIGKVIDIFEVAPKDRRLPKKMFDAGVGGLFAKVQFNMNSERGKEAFANVAFFGEEQEWSIGYKTIDADYDATNQANILKEVELYECSPVLHGANQLTGTLSVKDDEESSCGTDGELCAVKNVFDTEEPSTEVVSDIAEVLEKAVNTVFDETVTLWDFDDTRAVVTKNDQAWVINYKYDEDNSEYLFSKPKQAVLETFVRVLDGETKDAGCECGGTCGGCSGEKTLDEDTEVKGAKKIDARGIQKLNQAIDILRSIVSEVAPSEGPLEQKEPVGEKVLLPGDYDEFSKSLPFDCETEDEMVDVIEALMEAGVAVKCPTSELFAAGVKTLDVLLPQDERKKESVVLAMSKALSSVSLLVGETQ